MAGAEGIVRAFASAREPRYPLKLSQGFELIPSARQQLMRIGLMTDIPDDFFPRRIKNIVNRNRQFNGAQTRREVTAVSSNVTYLAG